MRRLLIVCVLAALGVGGWWWWQQRSATIELVRPPLPTADWQTYRAAVAQSAPVPGADAFLATITRMNRAEVAAGADPLKSPRFVMAAEAMREAAWQFAQRATPEGYLRLGRQRGLVMIDALQALMRWCADQKLTTVAALALDPPPPVVQAYIDAGGGFVRFAQKAGLVVDGRLERLPYVQALFLRHWISPLTQTMPLDAFVQRQERVWYLRWKVEWQLDGPIDSRLAAADELRAEPGYPADLNAGVILAKANRTAEARQRFLAAQTARGTRYAAALAK